MPSTKVITLNCLHFGNIMKPDVTMGLNSRKIIPKPEVLVYQQILHLKHNSGCETKKRANKFMRWSNKVQFPSFSSCYKYDSEEMMSISRAISVDLHRKREHPQALGNWVWVRQEETETFVSKNCQRQIVTVVSYNFVSFTPDAFRIQSNDVDYRQNYRQPM